jgi:hypothetical protein
MVKMLALNFGDFCLVEKETTKGVNEFVLYRVIGRVVTDSFVTVPIGFAAIEHSHGMRESCICLVCAPDKHFRPVHNFRECDVIPVIVGDLPVG